DLIQGNLAKGDGRGYRFHPSTLKFCIYYSGVAGTGAYNALREVLHLPSPSHIRNLRARAVPGQSGLLFDNIKRYGDLAAVQDADAAELMGSLAFDCVHLNKNGLSYAPNGAGLTGLVDDTTFFNPIFAENGEEEPDLEKTLGKIIATQHVELRAGTFKFGAFSQGDAEKSFAEFPVAFRHPVHGGPIFNMSDPPHILKKIANACWHSDLAGKQRALAMWCTDEHGNEKLVRFSLKTGERAYRLVENDGDSLST
ncbi:unnamed protein product, partial [Pylaiella littoralis]